MSELTNEQIVREGIEEVATEAKAKGTFNLKNVLEQQSTSYPEKEETVFLNGKAAAEALWIGDEIAEAKVEEAVLEEEQKKASGESMVGDPEVDEKLDVVRERIKELEAKQLAALQTARDSRLTFRMRGVAPKLFRAIDAKWRAKITPKSESEEDTQAALMARNERVNLDTIAASILSITDAEGNTDDSKVSAETVEALHGTLMMSEWQKIKNLSDMLTFGNGYFQQLVEEDADFLPKA